MLDSLSFLMGGGLKVYAYVILENHRAYQFWQEGVHPELIQDEEMMRQKVDYIHQNPVKRGYIDQAIHWRYSSARDYEGEAGLIDICRSW